MYFYPHWKKHLKKYDNWGQIINHFINLHPSILNTKKQKGGDYLYTLGKNKSNNIKINKKKFIKYLNYYLNGEDINSKNFFLAIHIAYSKCLKEDLNNKKLLFYHMHVCWYLKDFYFDFSNAKTITMIRELKSNIPNRIPSFEKPNEMHLNKTDSIFFKSRSYRNVIFEDFNTLDYLKKFVNKPHRVIKHEDLLTRKKKIMKNFCKYAQISYSQSLLKSTINNKIWNYKHRKKVSYKNGVAKHITSYNKSNFFNYELFWINNLVNKFNKIYSYKIKKKSFSSISTFLTFIFIFLPSKKEFSFLFEFFSVKFLKTYMNSLYKELISTKLKKYEKHAFYHHKWSNKNYPFKLINFLIIRLNKKKNILWILLYMIFKLLMYVILPINIIIEYVLRIVICIKVYFRNIFNLRFFPKKL